MINRVPSETKTKFIELAEKEFADDYGLCLKDCLDKRNEYVELKKYYLSLIAENKLKITIEDGNKTTKTD